jgi:hypothetical protein
MNSNHSRKLPAVMKLVLFVLITITVLSTACAITGTNIMGSWNAENSHWIINRFAAGIIAVYCSIATFTCLKSSSIGWWLVTLLWIFFLVSVFIGAVWNAYHIGLPLLGLILGGVGELVKISIGTVIFARGWLPLRKNFAANEKIIQKTDHSEDVTIIQKTSDHSEDVTS